MASKTTTRKREPAPSPTLTEQFEQRRQTVQDAERRVQELKAKLLQSRRSVERAKIPLRDYFEQLGAGEREPDPKLERKLRAEVHEAEAVVSSRPILTDGKLSDFEVVNVEVEAQLAGAQRAMTDRRAELEQFIADHREALCRERLEAAQEIGRRYSEAATALWAADGDWNAEVSFLIHALGVRSEDLPERPVTLDRDVRRSAGFVPAPRWLTRA